MRGHRCIRCALLRPSHLPVLTCQSLCIGKSSCSGKLCCVPLVSVHRYLPQRSIPGALSKLAGAPLSSLVAVFFSFLAHSTICYCILCVCVCVFNGFKTALLTATCYCETRSAHLEHLSSCKKRLLQHSLWHKRRVVILCPGTPYCKVPGILHSSPTW